MDIQSFIYALLGILNAMSPYVLLGFLAAGLLNEFVPAQTMSRHLSGRGVGPVFKAAMLGIPLPLCSCGVLPTAVGLRRRGASTGATTSFLIATPQTGVDSIAATYSMLGLPFAIIRPVAALAGAVFGGGAVAAFTPKSEADRFQPECHVAEETKATRRPLHRRLASALQYGLVDMVANMGKWLMIGLVVAALITVFVPDDFIVSLADHKLLAMLAMVVIAVPMYVCATGSIPIAMSLMLKGLSPGAAFVLLMAGPAANFASIIVLGRTLGARVTAVYVAAVILTAVLMGCIIDFALPAAWFALPDSMTALGCHHGHSGFDWFETACSALLVALLIYAAVKSKFNHKHNIETIMNNEKATAIYNVEGMNCNHCRASVEKAIAGVPGVEHVDVDLAAKKATVSGNADAQAIMAAVSDAGFSCNPA